jgi:hypothetical protein
MQNKKQTQAWWLIVHMRPHPASHHHHASFADSHRRKSFY